VWPEPATAEGPSHSCRPLYFTWGVPMLRENRCTREAQAASSGANPSCGRVGLQARAWAAAARGTLAPHTRTCSRRWPCVVTALITHPPTHRHTRLPARTHTHTAHTPSTDHHHIVTCPPAPAGDLRLRGRGASEGRRDRRNPAAHARLDLPWRERRWGPPAPHASATQPLLSQRARRAGLDPSGKRTSLSIRPQSRRSWHWR
jgi:hypothetical protein